MRIASYNIRKCVGLDRRRKPMRVLEIINQLDADVVALQEADRRLGERPAAIPAELIENESDFQLVTAGQNGPSIGWHGNAILVRKGLKATGHIQLDLPGTEPRGAISVVIEDRLQILATHLGLRRSDRRRQTQAISEFLTGSATPALVAGDLNEWSSNRGLEALASDFNIISPGRSFHAARPLAALDRIALSAGISWSDAGVVETTKSKIASDHLPIWTDITVPVVADVG